MSRQFLWIGVCWSCRAELGNGPLPESSGSLSGRQRPVCNDREVLGPWQNRPWLNALSSVIVATLGLLFLILMATTVFTNINVTTFALIGAAVLAARAYRSVTTLTPRNESSRGV